MVSSCKLIGKHELYLYVYMFLFLNDACLAQTRMYVFHACLSDTCVEKCPMRYRVGVRQDMPPS